MRKIGGALGLSVVFVVGCTTAAGPGGPSLAGSDGGGGNDGVASVDGSGAADSALDDGGSPDTGAPDTGTPDTGAPDTGTPDSGTPDTGTPDTGTPDTGTPDAGTPDTGVPDIGTPDTGTPDTGTPDTGTPDTGTPDTGTPDTGTPDSGSPDAGGPVCGDLVCAASEKGGGCPFDCSPTGVQVWPCVKSSCATETASCQAASSCVNAVGNALACTDKCATVDTACFASCQPQLGTDAKAISLMTCGFTKGCLSVGGPVCGDGTCNGTETPSTCPLDCKAVCGDGKCELPETALSCAKDCKPTFPACGDGVCAPNETAKSCAFDCDQAVAKLYTCVKGKCPTQTATCLKEPACQTAVLAGVECALACKQGDLGCLTGCAGKTSGNTTASGLVSCGLTCFL